MSSDDGHLRGVQTLLRRGDQASPCPFHRRDGHHEEDRPSCPLRGGAAGDPCPCPFLRGGGGGGGGGEGLAGTVAERGTVPSMRVARSYCGGESPRTAERDDLIRRPS
jgi:hypothetical protein